MRHKRLSLELAVLLGILIGILVVPNAAAHENILYSFNSSGIDGGRPYSGLVFDTAGNLYGTTFNGGRNVGGTVFQLTPHTGGGWTETILHNFATNQGPWGGLTIDSSGNLYGTTTAGGTLGAGVVFELSPQSGGGWTYTRLHSFGNGKDGQSPYGTLILDTAGNLYGTTMGGGAFQSGTVFELSPVSGGGWSERILHHFNSNGQDGTGPAAGVTLDAGGHLYGTTFKGGTFGAGTVFRLTAVSGVGWTYSILHEFGNATNDGMFPWGGVIVDAGGNVYGTTENGGKFGQGTVFALMPAIGGGYFRKTLHNFHEQCCDIFDGTNPLGTLVQDAAGNLYGTAQMGMEQGFGMVFKLTPTAPPDPWQETILYTFEGPFTDGMRPYAGLIFDASGDLYGTTNQGGASDTGTVFEIPVVSP